MEREVVAKLRKWYQDVPEVIFRRSVERTRTETELFDALDTLPNGFPLVWNMTERRWKRAGKMISE